MKNLNVFKLVSIALVITSIGFLTSCSDDDTTLNETNLSQTDKDGLLFMLEEEKLARDTYQYLYNKWSTNVFGNIKNSEQSHMNIVASILDDANVSYTILPEGEFENQDLQNYYNQFVNDGQISLLNALKIGATIEDLDIVDLEDYMNATTNTAIINAYQKLQCGSRNHLRSYVSQIVTNGDTYTPQFLSLIEFNEIISGSHENCN